MLVLSRVANAADPRLSDIVITHPAVGRIVVRLVRVDGRTVRIGVEADPGVRVNRAEVQEQIDRGAKS